MILTKLEKKQYSHFPSAPNGAAHTAVTMFTDLWPLLRFSTTSSWKPVCSHLCLASRLITHEYEKETLLVFWVQFLMRALSEQNTFISKGNEINFFRVCVYFNSPLSLWLYNWFIRARFLLKSHMHQKALIIYNRRKWNAIKHALERSRMFYTIER